MKSINIFSFPDDKLTSLGIGRDEVQSAVEHSEDTGRKTYDEASGVYTCSWRAENITLWVAYTKDDSEIVRIRNVYFNRTWVVGNPETDIISRPGSSLHINRLSAMRIKCCTDNNIMEPALIVFGYMNITYKGPVLYCPLCDLIYIDEDVSKTMSEVEKTLEWK